MTQSSFNGLGHFLLAVILRSDTQGHGGIKYIGSTKREGERLNIAYWGELLYSILDILIKAVVPVAAGILINYVLKKIDREKFGAAQDIVASIVKGIEQQYRSGQIAKEDRYILALRNGMAKTKLSEEQVAGLIQEAVLQFNLQIGKYDHNSSKQV